MLLTELWESGAFGDEPKVTTRSQPGHNQVPTRSQPGPFRSTFRSGDPPALRERLINLGIFEDSGAFSKTLKLASAESTDVRSWLGIFFFGETDGGYIKNYIKNWS